MEALVALVLACATVALAIMLARAVTRASSAEAGLETERRLREQEALAANERLDLVRGERDALETNLRAIAGEVLSGTTDQLIKLAAEQRKADQEQAVGEFGRRSKEVTDVVKPVAEHLKKLQDEVTNLQKERKGSQVKIEQLFDLTTSGLKELRKETGDLVKALKRPQVRGSWGEIQLRNVARMAGMTDHVDFHEQSTITTDDEQARRLRPDMTVHLPTGRDIVVDSKVPLDAYLDALEVGDDAERDRCLERHANHLRTHINQLGSKGYQTHLERSADFVVCFVPNEACYVAALDKDPSLIEHGIDKHVLLATPTTLLALLHATYYGWRQAAVEESAQEITDTAVALHERVGVFAEHYAKVGAQLGRATEAYNKSVSSYETRLLPQLRRIEDLGAKSKREIDAPAPVDHVARVLESGVAEGDGGEPRHEAAGEGADRAG